MHGRHDQAMTKQEQQQEQLQQTLTSVKIAIGSSSSQRGKIFTCSDALASDYNFGRTADFTGMVDLSSLINACHCRYCPLPPTPLGVGAAHPHWWLLLCGRRSKEALTMPRGTWSLVPEAACRYPQLRQAAGR